MQDTELNFIDAVNSDLEFKPIGHKNYNKLYNYYCNAEEFLQIMLENPIWIQDLINGKFEVKEK